MAPNTVAQPTEYEMAERAIEHRSRQEMRLHDELALTVALELYRLARTPAERCIAMAVADKVARPAFDALHGPVGGRVDYPSVDGVEEIQFTRRYEGGPA